MGSFTLSHCIQADEKFVKEENAKDERKLGRIREEIVYVPLAVSCSDCTNILCLFSSRRLVDGCEKIEQKLERTTMLAAPALLESLKEKVSSPTPLSCVGEVGEPQPRWLLVHFFFFFFLGKETEGPWGRGATPYGANQREVGQIDPAAFVNSGAIYLLFLFRISVYLVCSADLKTLLFIAGYLF